ncbi:hypothetical protein M758_4G092600 [Ceratodon purpureus]|uniref:Uncharacterized protein n=1 Tax=Ceratodon purpureus TaxID=3225 RepID=A0A8T0I772_CERPU|nr:hypothetical protein KC19_4G092000 [Ceratodon purpureus]KAG0618806.1 hypothetical protein M758_4G092600 [Ceratodon purpureus]
MESGGPESGGSGASTPSIDLRGDSSSRNVPIYVLFLIMLSSGIFTLIFLWICVQYIYHRRMIRQALGDLERMFVAERTWEAEAEADQITDEIIARHATTVPAVSELDPDAKCCDKNVELTYVVMAGEDQPTFLARPLNTSQEPASSSQTAM